MDIKNGEYTIVVRIDGISADSRIVSPAKLTAKDGSFTANVQWRGEPYDTIAVDGKEFRAAAGSSPVLFCIPVRLDEDMTVRFESSSDAARTEEHTLFFGSDTLIRDEGNPFIILFAGMAAICVLAAAVPAFLSKKKEEAGKASKKASGKKKSRG